MRKPARIALGIGVAAATCAVLGALASGPLRWLAWWTSAAPARVDLEFIDRIAMRL